MLVKKDKDLIQSYLEDASNLKGGYAEGVFIPKTIEELSEILKDACQKKTPVTISGGGTATTGSRVPFGGIVLSTEKFNKIIEISKEKASAAVEAGVMVEDLYKGCEKQGFFYTSHPTERTAYVGGTISTNASGARSFKYGSIRNYVKRLKMVLADGNVLDITRGKYLESSGKLSFNVGNKDVVIDLPKYRTPDIKNSSGYFVKDGMDLIDLFIGQEGTLSVIVEIELGLVKRPLGIFSSFVFFASENDAWKFCDDVRPSGALSLEYFSQNALNILRSSTSDIPPSSGAAIFFEDEINEANKDNILDKWLNILSMHKVPLDNTWVAMSESDGEKFTKMRHSIPEAVNDIVRRRGFSKISTDLSVPLSNFRHMAEFYMKTLEACGMDNIVFGHIGECHLHTNLLPKSQDEYDRAKEIALSFVKKAISFGGSVSAEHGIGKIKHKHLELMYGKSGILEMAHLKKQLDPDCILGLDNIFPKGILKSV